MPGSVPRATVGVQGQQDLFGRHLTRPPDRSTRARSPGAENILPLILDPAAVSTGIGIYRVMGRNGEPCLVAANSSTFPRACCHSLRQAAKESRSPPRLVPGQDRAA